MRYPWVVSVLLIFTFCAHAQDPLSLQDQQDHFQRGLSLYQAGQYAAARIAFEEYLNQHSSGQKAEDASYFVAASAIALYHSDAEKLTEDFIETYPRHPKATLAYYELGNFFYRERNYSKAASYFEKADLSALDAKRRAEARFKMGYAYFNDRRFEEAREAFNAIKQGNNPYAAAANYYSGYVAYRLGLYEEALVDFRRAEKDPDYDHVAPHMIVSTLYQLGRYDELITYATQVQQRSGPISEMDKIYLYQAHAYFQKGDYQAAADAYSQMAGSISKSLNHADRYKIAYAYFQTGQMDGAIDQFKIVALEKDSIGQLAAYYLGEAYLQVDNLQFALNAFEQAWNMEYIPDVRKEALFKLAKAHLEAGNFPQAIQHLGTYIREFPDATKVSEANDLLATAYLETSNYDLIIEFFKTRRNPTPKLKKAYQAATFYKATELFNGGRYFEAVQLFQESVSYPMDTEITLQAYFWMGETYALGNRYEEAIDAYQRVVQQASASNRFVIRAKYGLGYAYYNTKQYNDALRMFRQYLDAADPEESPSFYADALVRSGDCYYVLKEYSDAAYVYRLALRREEAKKDYALLQLGIVEGLQNNLSGASGYLRQLLSEYPRSPYADDAQFELAQLQFEAGEYQSAIQSFSRLVEVKPGSPFTPYAYLKRAVAYFNTQQYEKAASDYKKILQDYISHPAANSALLGLQEVLTLQGKSDQFDPYLAQYKRANPGNEALESIEFESAKTLYYNGKYQAAIDRFQDYLESYPNTPLASEAKYFIAESHYYLKQYDRSLSYYQQVLDERQVTQLNRVINRMADIYFEQGKYEQAQQYYRMLTQYARSEKDQLYALTGLMKSSFILGAYDSTITYANTILEMPSVNVNAENEAMLYRGKAAFEQGKYNEATDYFLQTLNTAKDESGAEAQFLLALIQHREGQYQQSLESLYNLNENFGLYDYWIGRSFLLIAENYYGMGETFQATATLESIIENAPLEEIKQMARARLDEINTSEQQKNSSDSIDN